MSNTISFKAIQFATQKSKLTKTSLIFISLDKKPSVWYYSYLNVFLSSSFNWQRDFVRLQDRPSAWSSNPSSQRHLLLPSRLTHLCSQGLKYILWINLHLWVHVIELEQIFRSFPQLKISSTFAMKWYQMIIGIKI